MMCEMASWCRVMVYTGHVLMYRVLVSFWWDNSKASNYAAGVSILMIITLFVVLPQVLQKMGKSDQTKDEVFQDFVNNFNKQYVSNL